MPSIDKLSESEKSTNITTAVIVAAGFGSRLKEAPIKPLMPLVGVPLIRRVIWSSYKAGIRRFVVVVGYKGDIMRRKLPALLPNGCELTVVENPDFKAPNGVSLMAATRVLNEPFALLMSDHIFSPDRLALALEHFSHNRENLLVVEKREIFNGDPDDATKVALQNGRIVAIGKGLEKYDAIDTGLFVLKPRDINEAFAAAGASPSISQIMAFLGSGGRLEGLYINSGFWQDVDTHEDILEAQRKLYSSLTKTTDGVLARLINRRISVFLSTKLWPFGITPNMVTAFTLILGLLAGVAFSRGSDPAWSLLGATLFQMQSIIDGVDGELARLSCLGSRFGFWFDIAVDNITHMAVFGGIAIGMIASGTKSPAELLGMLAVAGVIVDFALMAPLLDPQGKGLEIKKGLLKNMVDGLSRRDFTYILFPLAVFGRLDFLLWAAAVGTWVYAAVVTMLRFGKRG